MTKKYNIDNLPVITGGKKGGSSIAPNSLFSTDILFLLSALGEGPLYRINPNGPQDIEINDSLIDDLLILKGKKIRDAGLGLIGDYDTDKFYSTHTSGTNEQSPLAIFGDEIVIPQGFSSSVPLKKGNLASDGIPASSVKNQDTSRGSLDAVRFNFIIDALYRADDKGNVHNNTLSVEIKLKKRVNGILTTIVTESKTINAKTDAAFKFSIQINVPEANKNEEQYVFDVKKTNDDVLDAKNVDTVKLAGWDEIVNNKLSYPRTAQVGYSIKAADEHTGGVPTFTSLVKGLIVKVPSNYNQPITETGQIDWRELEVSNESDTEAPVYRYSYKQFGYRLQQTGTGTILYDTNPAIYTGVWDGTFVYSWTQNPVWIIYDLLTNTSHGLGISEENIDKYKFYQVAQYCDACDEDGLFQGVDGLADGSFRHKPRTFFTVPVNARKNQFGIPTGIKIKERRFTSNLSITEQESVIDLLNKVTSTFRSILVYAGGKITFAVDMPEEHPVMLFNDTNIKKGSFQLSGVKESDLYNGIDVSYVEPTNHYKREVISIRAEEANNGLEPPIVDNIASVDLMGVTRRSQAMRMAQYQLASARYVRRMVTFVASSDAVYLAPGDVISVASQSSGISYGYGGRISANSAITASGNTSLYLEHFTNPSISESNFTSNTNPLAMRVVKANNDFVDIYILDNTDYTLSAEDVISGYDTIRVSASQKFDVSTGTFSAITEFTAEDAPAEGDLWSFGEFEDLANYYSNKAGKLFKVTEVSRDPKEFTVAISAIEYLSNVYVDSDTFIDFEPTPYVDFQSPITTPPIPTIALSSTYVQAPDGSVTLEAGIETSTESRDYEHKFSTEYYVAYPTFYNSVDSVVSSSPLVLGTSNTNTLVSGDRVTLAGKNGFTSPVGVAELTCDGISTYTPAGVPLTNQLALSVPGLSLCSDSNFGVHMLEVTDSLVDPSISGYNHVNLSIKTKQEAGSPNFTGYQNGYETMSLPIEGYDVTNNVIYVAKSSSTFQNNLVTQTPFSIQLNQVLEPSIADSNVFFVKGTSELKIDEGSLYTGDNVIELSIKPKNSNDVTVYVDGTLISDYTVNKNTGLGIAANVLYTALSTDYYYRVESLYKTVPTIEVGDTLETNYANIYEVEATSFDSASADYDAALTANDIYKIRTNIPASHKLSGYNFVNTSADLLGTISNITSTSVEYTYDTDAFEGTFNHLDKGVYSLSVGDDYEKVFLTSDGKISDIPSGNLLVSARNRNVVGRTSPFIANRKFVELPPVRKITQSTITITESLYREQTKGVAIRATIGFDHIENQQVTEYEIGYRILSTATSVDSVNDLANFQLIQIPAEGRDSEGRLYFTVPNINRGTQSESTKIEFRVTPLNKNIRGIAAFATKDIIGKDIPPSNVLNFTGGQQTDQITLFWEYLKNANGDLIDIDLSEVAIYYLAGDYSNYSQEALNGLLFTATPLVTVAASSQRKTVPILNYGTYTYLAKTIDTSGNSSTDVIATVITTSRPKKTRVVAAYNEDDPSVSFSDIANNNSSETNYPSYNTDVAILAANGSSTGFSAEVDITNLLASDNATYVTQIRDYGTVVHASVGLTIEASQFIQSTYNDLNTVEATGVATDSGYTNIVTDSNSFDLLLEDNPRYDNDNRTWVTGDLSGGSISGSGFKVWAIKSTDIAEANAFAYIAEVTDNSTIQLGESYYANGQATGGNTFPSIATGTAGYSLVDLKEYKDYASTATYQGTLGATSYAVYMRTSTAANVYHANGDVDVSTFDYNTVNDGFVPYEAGSKPFRHLQLKLVITNNEPNEYDLILDKFRYTIEKEQVIFTDTVLYDTSPTTVDYSSSDFALRPVITYSILDQIDAETNTAIAVTTSASNSQLTFKLFAADGTGEYLSNSTANVFVTAIGV